MSLRISAARECFEESGILFLSKNKNLIQEKDLPGKSELQKWREMVEGDASVFFDVCEELGAFPNVENMFEWSNWLTPPSILPYRFDTAFYIAMIPEIPSYARQDGGETVDMDVLDPFSALKLQSTHEILLHPPQFVEISRMAKFSKLDDLMKYSKSRQEKGLIRWCPNQIFFEGCRVSAMEGDDLHIEKIEGPVDDSFSNQSESDQAKNCKNLSRTIWTYETDEKGRKIYKSMISRNNREYFDDFTQMCTPINETDLKSIFEKY